MSLTNRPRSELIRRLLERALSAEAEERERGRERERVAAANSDAIRPVIPI